MNKPDLELVHDAGELELVAQNVGELEVVDKAQTVRIDPCPWCGGRRMHVESTGTYYRGHCWDCDTFSPTGSTPAQALDRWNRRAAITVFPRIVTVLREMLFATTDPAQRAKLEGLLTELRGYYRDEDQKGPMRSPSKWD
jgi:hypothetical protein